MAGRRHLSLEPGSAARRDLRRRHAAANRVGVAPHRPRVLVLADRHPGPLRAHARQEHLLPARLGRQRRADRAPRAEPLPRALRPDTAARPRSRARTRDRQDQEEAAARDLAPQLPRPVSGRDRRGREGVPRVVRARRALGGLAHRVHDDRRVRAHARAALVPRSVREGARVHGRSAVHVGRRLPDGARAGRHRRQGETGRVPRHRIRRGGDRRRLRDLDDAPRAAAGVRRRHRAPGRRALPGALRQERDHAAVPRARTDLPERQGRPREGHRHPDGVHVRRSDRRRVVARAGSRPAPGARQERPAPAGVLHERWRLPESRPRACERRLRRDRGQGRAPGAAPHRRAARRGRALGDRKRRPAPGRAAPDRTRRQVLREGRQPARDPAEPAVVHPPARQEGGAPRQGRADPVAPGAHGAPLPRLDREPGPRLVHQPPTLFRCADPGLVSARRERPTRLRRGHRRHAGPDAGRPDDRRAGRLRRVPARPARRLHGRGRHLRHVVHEFAVAPDRQRLGTRPGQARETLPGRRAAAEPRDHPHVGVLHDREGDAPRGQRAVAPRRDLGMDPRPPTARRCRRASATP